MSHPPLEDLLARLERERQDADRRYNDALTAINRAIRLPPSLPEPPPALASSSPNPESVAKAFPEVGRIGRFVARLLGVPVNAQARLHADVIAGTERAAAVQEAQRQTLAALVDRLNQEFAALAGFESLLVQSLQRITAYVDTKDRALGGSELRDRLAMLEQRTMAMKRELEQRHTSAPTGLSGEAAAGPQAIFAGRVDSSSYVGFEDRFRGHRDEIRGRVEDYVPILRAASDVVDIGCGRGELLDLLKAAGVSARGVDGNESMAAACRARGLNAECSDALAFLDRQADSSIGGLVAIQVVEHFEPGYLVRFLETAYRKMGDGAPLVLETLNPACWMAFFECYIRDLTHQRPLHPDTLRYLVEAAGFRSVDVQFRQPVRDADRLSRVDWSEKSAGAVDPRVVAALNDHADKLNARLFSSMDYVVLARR